MKSRTEPEGLEETGVAVVGMAGRFPGARGVAEFWENLRAGVEGVRFFTDEELAAAGIGPDLLSHPGYVKARALVEGVEWFDASFFGFTPREAEALNPQHRLMLECAWEALEDAGFDAERFAGRIGVYVGASFNSYFLDACSRPELVGALGSMQLQQLNFPEYVSTLISYKLNLRGPSMNVQTTCSTSLVAVHVACQSLLGGECDAALAGGVRVTHPQQAGYLYQEGGINSADGHCRSYDAGATGTHAGSGAGIVVLRRYADAVADGDTIHAVIRGSAVNNDGSGKLGYTAPSVEGQASVIAEALAVAGVEADSISYVEGHGTATPLGDPIEMQALGQAFRAQTERKNFCALGSVKSNVGHLDTAAGVTGLIKTVLALRHKELPPSLHFERPNPAFDLASSPFYVNSRLRAWEGAGQARRAGVSSFGIGGTNAHVILEEAPAPEPGSDSRPAHLLTLSARTPSALEAASANLARHLREHPEQGLADVAYTLHVGRHEFAHRRALVCSDAVEAARALGERDPRRLLTAGEEARRRRIVFMFTGQGAQLDPELRLE